MFLGFGSFTSRSKEPSPKKAQNKVRITCLSRTNSATSECISTCRPISNYAPNADLSEKRIESCTHLSPSMD